MSHEANPWHGAIEEQINAVRSMTISVLDASRVYRTLAVTPPEHLRLWRDVWQRQYVTAIPGTSPNNFADGPGRDDAWPGTPGTYELLVAKLQDDRRLHGIQWTP